NRAKASRIPMSPFDAPIAGEEAPLELLTLDERVHRAPVGGDGSPSHRPLRALQRLWGSHGSPAPTHALRICSIHVADPQSDVAHAVPMQRYLLGDRPLRPQRCGEDEGDAALPQHVANAVPHAGLWSSHRDNGEPEEGSIEVGGLVRIANPELD